MHPKRRLSLYLVKTASIFTLFVVIYTAFLGFDKVANANVEEFKNINPNIQDKDQKDWSGQTGGGFGCPTCPALSKEQYDKIFKKKCKTT